MFLSLGLLSSLVLESYAWPSVRGLGGVGGRGPQGGIGDVNRPVLKAQSFVTDQLIAAVPNDLRRLSPGPPPVLVKKGSKTCSTARQVVVDATSKGRQQEMLGYGFAWTDSTVTTFDSLEPEVLDQVMDDLFGQDGNNMGFMRHTMGSSDLSGVDNFGSYDDNGPSYNLGEPDPSLSHFNLGRAGTAMAKMMARMGSYKSDVFLFGSPWSYPGWMKNNALFIAPNIPNGYNILNNSFNPAYIPQAVDYLTKYVDAFKGYGVNVNGLTLQNEPLNYQGGYPCMLLEPGDAASIINQGLGAAMHERNVKIIAYDHNTDQPGYPYRVWQGAPNYVDGVGWHCYQSPSADYTVLQDFLVESPSTLQFMTECTSYMPLPGQYSSWIAQHFMDSARYGASGGTFWVLGTDPEYGPHSPYGGCAGCLGAIIVNSTTTYTKTLDYYMAGQFSRFIRRGAINHYVSQGFQGSEAVYPQFYIMAVQNPDQSWAIVFNNGLGQDEAVVLTLDGEDGMVWEGTIPASTVVTWLLPARERCLKNGDSGTAATATLAQAESTCPPLGPTATLPTQTLPPVPNTTHTIAHGYF